MRVLRSFLFLLLSPLLLAGCLEVEHHYTLNPDGSGKVAVEANIVEWGLDDTDENAPQELRDHIKKYLDETQGVDAWKDVTYSFNDGKIHFRGTAYFPDIQQLKSSDLSLGNLSMTTDGGNTIVTMDLDADSDMSMSSSTTEDGVETETPLSEEEIQHQIDSLKENWGMMKGMMAMVLKEMVIKTALDLPGTPSEVTGFTRQGNELVYEFHGDKMLEAMDTMMTNPEFLRQQAMQKSDDMPDQIKTVLFPNGEPRIVFPANAPTLFNYQKEMAAARKEQTKIMQELEGKKPAAKSTKKKRK